MRFAAVKTNCRQKIHNFFKRLCSECLYTLKLLAMTKSKEEETWNLGSDWNSVKEWKSDWRTLNTDKGETLIICRVQCRYEDFK